MYMLTLQKHLYWRWRWEGGGWRWRWLSSSATATAASPSEPVLCLLLGVRLCSTNYRPGYWSNLPCDWPSTALSYSEQRLRISAPSKIQKMGPGYQQPYGIDYVTDSYFHEEQGCQLLGPYQCWELNYRKWKFVFHVSSDQKFGKFCVTLHIILYRLATPLEQRRLMFAYCTKTP